MHSERLGSSQKNDDDQRENTPSAGAGRGQVRGTIQPLRMIRNRKSRERRIPALQEEMEWKSGLMAYEEDSFERLRTPRTNQWSVVWSDLMMTMFILFVVLYVFHSMNKETVIVKAPTIDIGIGSKIKDRGPVEPFSESGDSKLARIYDLSRQVVDEESMQDIARVDLAPDKTVRIILTGDLLFDSGSAEIKGSAMQDLQKIIPLIAQTPSMVNVVGHTDDIPIETREFPSNWELSLVRASRIAHFLMRETNLAESRFYVSGHGSTQPVAANDTPEHRAANRRVEIILTREKPSAIATREGEP